MPKIYAKIKNHLAHGLNESMQHSKRADFCIGYFYMGGWKQVAEKIDSLEGAIVSEGDNDIQRNCRLLVDMNKSPLESIREHFASVMTKLMYSFPGPICSDPYKTICTE